MRKLIKNIYVLTLKSGTSGRSLKLISREFKFFWQRLTRGYDDSETWSLCVEHAKWMAPRLKRFIEIHNGHPCHLDADGWNNVLNDMLYSFDKIAKDDIDDLTEEENNKIYEGLKQFSVWYMDLWW